MDGEWNGYGGKAAYDNGKTVGWMGGNGATGPFGGTGVLKIRITGIYYVNILSYINLREIGAI
jgi:hypothetical protein